MYGWIARWFVSRSIDEGRAVPAWVARRMERDEALRQFDLASRRMIQRLQDDAPQWLATRADPQWFSAPSEKAGRVSTRAVGWSAVVAIATGLLLTVTLWRNPSDSGDAPTPDLAARAPEIVSLDLQPLRDRMIRGRQLIDRLTSDARELSPGVVLPQPSQAVALTAQRARDAGTLFGRSLAILDRAAREQGNTTGHDD
jgi:hypothetical protein